MAKEIVREPSLLKKFLLVFLTLLILVETSLSLFIHQLAYCFVINAKDLMHKNMNSRT